MKAAITSTNAIVEMKDPQGRCYSCRVWEGVTEKGVLFTAYIGMIQVFTKDDNSEFAADLSESKLPQPATSKAMDLRFFID